MRILVSTLIFSLSALNAFAVERDVEIECKLTTSQSATVDTVLLYSATDEIEIQYRDGSSETVKPVEATNEGLFGAENFSADIVWNNGQVYTPTTAVGPIYIKFGCYISPTIFFERCISQGTREPARFAGVRMNLHGHALEFFGENICLRTDRSPL